MIATKRLFLTSMLAGAIGPAVKAVGLEPQRTLPLPVEGTFPSLAGATTWLGSPPLTPNGLLGKVVLIDFWTYSCINWLRTVPAVRAWNDAYRRHGLIVLGVHTPEFDFERDLDNVRHAISAMHVDWPVAVDSDAAIWRAFGNEYWPALYIVDAQGRIRHHHHGEGDEEGSERAIRQLLAEAGASDLGSAPVAVDARGIEAPADWADLKSGENYIGHGRTEGFASRGGIAPGRRHAYTAPSRLAVNTWGLSGEWTVGEAFATPEAPGGRIVYRFHARDLHIVLGSRRRGSAVRFRVRVDGVAPGGDHGLDVDEQGLGTVSEPRLYQLVRQTPPIADRLFEIEFLDAGAQVYSFTFG